jgi:hypothetical protein
VGGVLRVDALPTPPTRLQRVRATARFGRSPERGHAGHAARTQPLRVVDGVPQHLGSPRSVVRRYGSRVETRDNRRQRISASIESVARSQPRARLLTSSRAATPALTCAFVGRQGMTSAKSANVGQRLPSLAVLSCGCRSTLPVRRP